MPETIIDGDKEINSSETSKKGYPIVNTEKVDCAHCDDVHEADYRDSDVGYDVPGGHKRHCHYTCPETGYPFAADSGSRVR